MTQRFKVTEEHIKLIEQMYIDYNGHCEFGAPAVDPKRPYGNSDVHSDIAEILGIVGEEVEEDYFEWTDEQLKYMNQLHQETATVLQIIIATKSFEPGLYEADDYRINWRRVADTDEKIHFSSR